MATSYAAFTSLMHLISDLQEHPYPPIILDEELVNSLNSKISIFQRFLEDHHTSVDLELELRIADAAYAAEDVIENHIADKVLDEEDFNGSLRKAIEGMDLIEKEVREMNWNTEKKKSSQGSDRPTRRPAANNSDGENDMVVGMEDLTIEIVDKLTHGSGRHVVSITGMGGIGKTTLANKVYNHPYVGNYFDVRAWATISKDYNIRESLIELVHCLDDKKESKESLRGEGEHVLSERLHKSLFGKRYLVIVDDLWDVEAWDSLRLFLPDSRGSGIVITTRESRFASISSHAFAVGLLERRQAWDLFCKTVFGQDDCPCELEDVGKEISDNCRGLPLSVVVIGGHLARTPRTQEYWKYVAENLSSTVNSVDDEISVKILSLSYVHLPVHLKPCFLYMGIFPEDEEIKVDKLIRLWVAEGFLKPICGKSLEEAAQDYLNDLVSRNLILVSSESSRRGELVTCMIHDLLRDLSLKEAIEKKFLYILRKQQHDLEVPNNVRRIVLYPTSYVLKLPSVLRTLILHGTSLPSLLYNKSLRVLYSATNHMDIRLNDMVEVGCQLVNLRCLRLYEEVSFPSSIISIWNLQYLFLPRCIKWAELPEEIWKMSQLRHIDIYRGAVSLSDPPHPSKHGGGILKNLQSAKTIQNLSFREDLVKRIPNVRKLIVEYNSAVEGFSKRPAYALHNIARLEKLESFTCWFHLVSSMARLNGMLSSISFPHSLKELSASSLSLDGDLMTNIIGSLPLLEKLILYYCMGSEWNHIEGKFVRLKYLKLNCCCYIKSFTADSNQFPCLEELVLSRMDSMEEISSDVGDIQTLRCIELELCSDSAVESAKEMADYQKHQMGNEQLQIKVSLDRNSSLSADELSASNFFIVE